MNYTHSETCSESHSGKCDCAVAEVASIRTNQERYEENWQRIFGEKYCPCRDFCVNNEFIDGQEVKCADCGRVMAEEVIKGSEG